MEKSARMFGRLSVTPDQDKGVEAVRRTFRCNIVNVYPAPIEDQGPPRAGSGECSTFHSQVSDLSETSGLSKESDVSSTSELDLGWTEEQRDHFEERAAIMEYDGQIDRRLAEYLARGLVQRSVATRKQQPDNGRQRQR